MTAGAGVPVTRDEMDSLLGELSGYLWAASRSDVTAEELRDRAEEARFTCDALRQQWEIAALAAASGPDAGTGELCGACIGQGCEVCDGVGFTVDAQHADDCDGTCRNCPVAVQTQCERCAPASGAAPEERDGELDRLLLQLRLDTVDKQSEDPAERMVAEQAQQATTAAIHVHVAQRERAAREAGRAEMGEVVGQALLMAHYKDGEEYRPDLGSYSPSLGLHLKPGEAIVVDLVRRRGKEEG